MADVLHGTPGNNQLNATANRTQVYGLQGNDTLTNDGKSDVLIIGGSGDDRLIMAGGKGTLSGGAGKDTFELNYSASQTLSAVIEDLDPVNDKIVVNFDGNTSPQLTTVTSGNDVVLRDGGGNFNVTLNSVRDNDYFDGTISDKAWEILKLTNDEREKPTTVEGQESITAEAKNLPWLTLSDGLTKAASIRAEEIAKLGASGILDIYEHTRPDDKGNYSTIFDEVGKHYPNNGENIHAGSSLPAGAMSAWIGSLSHHENILNANFHKLGVGYKFVPEVEVDSNGKKNHHYWEQLFGGSLSAGEMETVSTADLLTANPEVHTISTAVTLTEGNDTYSNSVFGATIAALGGNDSITNGSLKVSISGGADNDTIDNRGSFVTINAGTGDDSINLNAAQEVLIQYLAGDGSDTVSGINSSDTLSISGGGEYTPVTLGNDFVVSLGADSITFVGAANSSFKIEGVTHSKLYTGTDKAESLNPNVDGATVQALGGDDTITNSGSNASINAGAGNDSIINSGQNVVFFHEGGNDTIGGFNATSTLKIAGGSYASVTIGNDLILKSSADSIKLLGAARLSSVNITDANGNPVTVGDAKDIRGTDQADNLSNDLDGATIRAFGGDDTITNSGEKVSIYGGTGNDSVNNQKHGTTYVYESGDDTIEGFNDSDTLNIGGYTSDTEKSGNDVIVKIINGSATVGTVTLKDYSWQVNVASTYVRPAVPGEEVSNSTNSVSVMGTANNDTIRNYGSNVTIYALAGNDTVINNYVPNVTIIAGEGNDSIDNNFSSNVTINGGEGNDSIDNNGGNSFNVSINSGSGNDSIYNQGDSVTIDGGTGNDTIRNFAQNVTIRTGDGDDSIVSRDDSVTIDGGTGNDVILNWSGENVSIFGNDGNDSIENWDGANITIDGGVGNDSIENEYSYVTIDTGDGDNVIHNERVGIAVSSLGSYSTSYVGDNVSIKGGNGNDSIFNSSWYVTIDSGNGDDTIYNGELLNYESYTIVSDRNEYGGLWVIINSSDGNDVIDNGGSNVTINASAGEDTIYNNGTNVTMLGGTGDDRISLSSSSRNNYIRYDLGDGYDTIWGITDNDTVNLPEVAELNSANSRITSLSNPEDDLIIRVRTNGVITGEITFVGGMKHPPHFTFGESNASGGISGDGGSGGSSSGGSGGSSSGSGGGRGGNDGGNTSGGTSSNEGNTSAASGGRSAVGSSGNHTSTGISSGSGSSGGSSGRVSRYVSTNRKDSIASAASRNLYNEMTATQPTATTTQNVYVGGNQVIANYQSGDKIIFGTDYTGAFYDGAGNFFAGSSTGALAVENAMDKVIDLRDAAGNDFVKAYAATNPGVIDGRNIAGFEVINGSAGADAIFAGDGGSQLWGGADVATDILVGGGGSDIFIVSKYQGSDLIVNASSKDVVYLSDANLSDIIATEENNGVVAVAFNTGNVVAVQSSEALSSTFLLNDGSSYRYNHAAKSWQGA